jgi:hypothetical protein
MSWNSEEEIKELLAFILEWRDAQGKVFPTEDTLLKNLQQLSEEWTEEELWQIISDSVEEDFNRTMNSLLAKGCVEISGVDEDGEFYFQVTDKGRSVVEKDNKNNLD